MTDAADVTIVIATCRRSALLRLTLDSLAAARLPQTLREVLVVENGGAHGAQAVAESFAGQLPVRYLLQVEGNKCRALNTAVAEAVSEFVCFFDDDVRVDRETIATYAEAAARYGPGHHFSGPLVADWEVEPSAWLKDYLPASAVGWDKGDEEFYFDRPWFIGSNWAAFRQDMQAVGGYLEYIGPGSPSGAIGDETELQKRLLAWGNRAVYLPDARVWHHVPAEDCDYDWAIRRQERNGLTYGLLGWTPHEGAVREGLTGWADLAVLTVKVAVARALGWSDERRVWLEMTRARTLGYLRGRRRRRRYAADEAAREPVA